MVYELVGNQQQYNHFTGSRLGLRLEAVKAAIDWMMESGQISDPDTVMRRIWIMDDAVNQAINAKIAAAAAADQSGSNPE